MESQRSQFSGSNNEWNCGSRVFNFIEKKIKSKDLLLVKTYKRTM